MRLSRQFQSCFLFLFFIFYEKILKVKKAPKRKINNFPPSRSFFVRKIVAVVVFCSVIFVLLVCLGLIFNFMLLKFKFLKKAGLKLS